MLKGCVEMKMWKRDRLPVLGMSSPKAQLELKLKSKSSMIMEHLLKLYLYSHNESAYGHWQSEIYSLLNSVPKLKSNNKYPDKKFLMANLYRPQDHNFDAGIWRLQLKYGELNWNHEINVRFNKMSYDYFDQLSDSLSKVGHVKSSEVYQMLDNAGF